MSELDKLIQRARFCKVHNEQFIWDLAWLNQCEVELFNLRQSKESLDSKNLEQTLRRVWRMLNENEEDKLDKIIATVASKVFELHVTLERVLRDNAQLAQNDNRIAFRELTKAEADLASARNVLRKYAEQGAPAAKIWLEDHS